MTRLRPFLALAAAGAAALAVSAAAPPARASVTCSFNAGTVTVDLAAGDTATIQRFGSLLHGNNQACGGATVDNTTTVTVTGASAAAAEAVRINLSGGAFTGTGGEIHFGITLNGTTNTATVIGSAGPDNIALGSPGAGQGSINLNAGAGNTPDVTLNGVTTVVVSPGSGSDTVNAQGGAADGGDAALGLALTMSGGPGNDHLTGG